MTTTLTSLLVTALGCVLLDQPVTNCTQATLAPKPAIAGTVSAVPEHTGAAVDVVLTAQAAIAWDVDTGKILYEKNADELRPVASISKLASALAVQSLMSQSTIVEIPPTVRQAQLSGANIQLPIGQHASVEELLEASMIASANDAMVALADASSGSEEEFVAYVNSYIPSLGLTSTKLANATGLEGGDQHSTARDVMRLLSNAYEDALLRSLMVQADGILVTEEGVRRSYKTTNDLIGTYIPVLAGKTGYTHAARENVAIITEDEQGKRIGAVVLGSDQRFQDMKILIEWVWRNYTWPSDASLPTDTAR